MLADYLSRPLYDKDTAYNADEGRIAIINDNDELITILEDDPAYNNEATPNPTPEADNAAPNAIELVTRLEQLA
ncbi:hypothetical protein OCS_06876 [Ophiocordyceps sinensis CO18]|uniref:Uncharacterized protein n=1 Tax=Ophiocordyceps sinensis (strain Co18 / CGMCC 3.14243) TaxID=911162 RepID=T5A6M7_OPHSC|nr:hypothetical protein OCS_06876 [Ophiocordyceps sinensis CO18]